MDQNLKYYTYEFKKYMTSCFDILSVNFVWTIVNKQDIFFYILFIFILIMPTIFHECCYCIPLKLGCYIIGIIHLFPVMVSLLSLNIGAKIIV